MPGMDGIEVTGKIRSLPGGDKTTIVSCTEAVMENEMELFMDADFDDYIMKPVNKNELLSITAKFIG